MKIFIESGEVVLDGVTDFDIAKTFDCGQCFRWNDVGDGVYEGVAFGLATRLRQDSNGVHISCSRTEYENVWKDYFDLERDYATIREKLCIDDFMQKATDFGAGIRILKQEKWEALCSFIISQNNHIPRIKKIVEALCELFGDEVYFENKKYYTFPSAERLSQCSIENLFPLRCGYRAEYIIATAKAVASGTLDLDALSKTTPEFAKYELKKIKGIGNKVADCVLLFGLNMLNAFPIDVWMKRALENHFDESFNPHIFNPYAGIAQQYIFHYERNTPL